MSRPAVAVIVALMLLGTGPAPAGQTPSIFVSRTEAVRVDVSVMQNGVPVTGLEAGDFELLDNGVPQQIDFVGFADTAVSVTLAIDTSRSVQGTRLDQLRAAGQRLVEALQASDEAGLITFTHRVVVRSPLTSSRVALTDALSLPAEDGDTALVDAVYTAMLTGAAVTSRPLVIVMSDGEDTASFLRADDVLDAARRIGPVIYAVTTSNFDRGGFLDELVRLTGGRRLDATFDRLGATFQAILDEARHRYLLAYTPQGVDADGWHELRVRLRNGRNAEIRARPGYLAGP